MLFADSANTEIRSRRTLSASRICYGTLGFCLVLLLLKNSEDSIAFMNRGLLLCAKTVIPSLFPFLVLSELIVQSNAVAYLPKAILTPLRILFGLPAEGCTAILLGALCGFPVGARCTVAAYRQGKLSREEAERALCCSNHPSSAFLISAVGTSLWGNRKFGIALYAVTLVTGTLIGVLLSVPRRRKWQERAKRTSTALGKTSLGPVSAEPLRGSRLFTAAVRSATEGILQVCAYVIFFSAVVGTLRMTLDAVAIPPTVHAFLFCFFELSGGMSIAAALGNTYTAALLCAFAAGWSGLSVHFQVLSVCDGCPFSFRKYMGCKLSEGILCAWIFGTLLLFFPEWLIPAQITSIHC